MDDLKDMLKSILDCFRKKGHWFLHKSNDGEWVEVSEDLNDHLTEVEEYLDTED
jgi:hypothetical protein